MGINSIKRVFKTARFSKEARKIKIKDSALCDAIAQVMLGQGDDLGGGVFKKRLNDNLHRSIILTKGAKYWIFEYLFAKKDRDNISDDELTAFRLLAKSYAGLSAAQLSCLLADHDLLEICHDNPK